jgi:hypothetical protein
MFALTMWIIWKRRNDKLWNDVGTQPAASAMLAMAAGATKATTYSSSN